MNGKRDSSKKLVIGSAFGSIGQVQSHLDLPNKTSVFREGRKSRIESIVSSIVTPKQIRAAQFEATFLIVQTPIVSSSRYPRRASN